MPEEWRAVDGYSGEYHVSNYGRVMSYKDKRIRLLKACIGRSGYPHVILCKDGKTKTIPVHKLVLEAFKGKMPKGCEARHMDGTKTNNRADNLEWGTRSQNSRDKFRHGTDIRGKRNPNVKLTKKEVVLIKAYLKRGYTCASIGRMFGVNKSTILDIKNGHSWSWVEG